MIDARLLPHQDMDNPVHPSKKAHAFDFDPKTKKLCRKRVDPSTKIPKWLKLHPLQKIGPDK